MDKLFSEEYELFSKTKIPKNNFFAVRVDGRAFHSEVEKMKLKRPLDKLLRDAIVEASIEVMKDFRAIFAYTESDEVTFLFPRSCDLFKRRAEKISSLLSAKMSVAFNSIKIIRETGVLPIFDARVLILPDIDDVVTCFKWRQMDSKRNSISTILFWNMIKKGVSKREATKRMEKMKDHEKKSILKKEFDISFTNCENWKKMGTMIFLLEKENEGFNPIKNEKVKYVRKKFVSKEVSFPFTERNLRKFIDFDGD